jgi:hypothetical protein
MIMAKKSIQVEEGTHRRAKILSAETGLSIGEIVDLLVNGSSEKQIRELAKKEGKK